jgi:hypothetical protein
MRKKTRVKRNSNQPKKVLRLPDLEHAKSAVPDSLTSNEGRRCYCHAIDEFVDWYCSEPRLAFNRTVGSLEFCFDNETPRHRVYLDPFQLANRKITCREYLEFMSDDGYTRPGLWLSDGWDVVRQSGWEAPLYWERGPSDEAGWRIFTLRGTFGQLQRSKKPQQVRGLKAFKLVAS